MTIFIPSGSPIPSGTQATAPAPTGAPTHWTKGDIVRAAFGELTLTDDSGFGVTPGETAQALQRLDGMLGTWAAKGMRLGYAFPAGGQQSCATDDSGLSDTVVETVYLNLARRLSSMFGKQLSAETIKNAREGYDTLLWAAAHPIEQQLPHSTPMGSGNKPWRMANRAFMPHPDGDPLRVADSGDLSILQE